MNGSNLTSNLLVPFLRTLADKVENNEVSKKQLQQVGEFFMTFLFQNQSVQRGEDTNDDTEEFKKFISLGWYIYTFIID